MRGGATQSSLFQVLTMLCMSGFKAEVSQEADAGYIHEPKAGNVTPQ